MRRPQDALCCAPVLPEARLNACGGGLPIRWASAELDFGSAKVRPIWTNTGDQIQPKLRADDAQILADAGPESDGLRPALVEVGQFWAKLDQHLVDIGQVWTKPVPNSARCGLRSTAL